jgi:hypothetical protein
VCLHEPTFSGCLIAVKPVGMFKMRGEKGIDDKIICAPLHDPYWNKHETLEDLPLPLRQEIERFFSIYKDLEGKEVITEGWRSLEEARDRGCAGAPAPVLRPAGAAGVGGLVWAPFGGAIKGDAVLGKPRGSCRV